MINIPENLKHLHKSNIKLNAKELGRKRLTTEQFKESLQKAFSKHGRINPERFDFSEGTYTCANDPILTYCTKHGQYWAAMPRQLVAGRGCPQCGIENMARRIKTAGIVPTYAELRRTFEKLNIGYTLKFSDAVESAELNRKVTMKRLCVVEHMGTQEEYSIRNLIRAFHLGYLADNYGE